MLNKKLEDLKNRIKEKDNYINSKKELLNNNLEFKELKGAIYLCSFFFAFVSFLISMFFLFNTLILLIIIIITSFVFSIVLFNINFIYKGTVYFCLGTSIILSIIFLEYFEISMIVTISFYVLENISSFINNYNSYKKLKPKEGDIEEYEKNKRMKEISILNLKKEMVDDSAVMKYLYEINDTKLLELLKPEIELKIKAIKRQKKIDEENIIFKEALGIKTEEDNENKILIS